MSTGLPFSCFIRRFKHVIWGKDGTTTHFSRITSHINALSALNKLSHRPIQGSFMHHDICSHSSAMGDVPKYPSTIHVGWALLGPSGLHKQTFKFEKLPHSHELFENWLRQLTETSILLFFPLQPALYLNLICSLIESRLLRPRPLNSSSRPKSCS